VRARCEERSTSTRAALACCARAAAREEAKANNKISEQTSKQSILDHRLLPRFGAQRLDSFTVFDLDRMKAEMLDDEYSAGLQRIRHLRGELIFCGPGTRA
jgi:hypothetical protein